MAHVVGVPRRDPCQKCQLPVFLAERLTVGKKVFHRTCLKCARCGSQLTIGSFYETEVDDVFCCETCPDEEEFDDGLNNEATSSKAMLRRNDNDGDAITSGRSVRSSIADRLAFFEQGKANLNSNASESKVLEKSVSDEEKTKSLQGIESTTATTVIPYKMNSALSSFLNDTIDGDESDPQVKHGVTPVAEAADNSEPSSQSISVGVGLDNEKDATPMETSDTEPDSEEDESSEQASIADTNQVPALPKTQPPLEELHEKPTEQPNKRFTATAQLQLAATSIGDELANDIVEQKAPKSSESNQTVATIEISENNHEHEIKETKESEESPSEAHESQTHKTVMELDLSSSNVNESVTKDKNADATQAPAGEEKSLLAEETVELRQKPHEAQQSTTEKEIHSEDKATTERLSVVRARLQQFEEITNNNNFDNNNLKSTSPNEDNNLTRNETNDKIKLNDVNNGDNGEDDSNDVIRTASNTLEEMNEETIEEDTVPKSMLEANEVKITESQETEVNTSAAVNEGAETIMPVTPQPSPRNVPLQTEIKDEEKVIENKQIEETKNGLQNETVEKTMSMAKPAKSPGNTKTDNYPEDLNPFKSDDEEDDDEDKENAQSRHSISKKSDKSENSNPFDSSDDEIELEKSPFSKTSSTTVGKTNSSGKIRPPRPPPPRISRNPFDDETDEEQNFSRGSSQSSSTKKRTPVPTPRTNLSQSQNPTPEATPRLSSKTPPHSLALHNSSEHYGSVNSLGITTPLHRNSDLRGSNNSLTSSAGGTIRSRKNRKAPAPPQPPTVKELFPSTETLGSSKTSTPSSSTVGSPKSARKKRPAPAPPKPARLDSTILPEITHDHELNNSVSKNLHSYPLQSTSESKLSDEEKALLEGKAELPAVVLRSKTENTREDKLAEVSRRNSRRLIPLDAALLQDAAENAHEAQCDDQKQQQLIEQDEHNVVYRRVIMPPRLSTPTHDRSSDMDALHSQDRQSEKLKDNKEAKNRNRQSQQSASSGAEDNDTIYNKSAHGKWKRRKGPAPALPIPPRRVLQMLPLQEIRHELDIIEVQQQGLEKQGVVLEKMIRDRCEGQGGEPLNAVAASSLAGAGDSLKESTEGVQNSKEVEDLILQLFELVNEKNDLFRRQAELMYLRRQHRLEQEQADLEYEIRVLMAQPERNKTDTDKSREEALIARLVEVVQLRNDVVECLEMDRLREAEEDLSIKQRLEQHTAKRGSLDDSVKKSGIKLSKKEKKKQKEAKKLSKNKKIDADKDADESELTTDKQKLKKKKRKFLF